MALQTILTICPKSKLSRTSTLFLSLVSLSHTFSLLECFLTSLITFITERVILKKKKEFKDMNAQENIDKLNQELIDVNKIMTESFEMLLNRDNNLSKIQAQSANLRDSSKDLRKGAKNLKMSLMFRKYMTPIIICLIVTFLILMKLFVF